MIPNIIIIILKINYICWPIFACKSVKIAWKGNSIIPTWYIPRHQMCYVSLKGRTPQLSYLSSYDMYRIKNPCIYSPHAKQKLHMPNKPTQTFFYILPLSTLSLSHRHTLLSHGRPRKTLLPCVSVPCGVVGGGCSLFRAGSIVRSTETSRNSIRSTPRRRFRWFSISRTGAFITAILTIVVFSIACLGFGNVFPLLHWNQPYTLIPSKNQPWYDVEENWDELRWTEPFKTIFLITFLKKTKMNWTGPTIRKECRYEYSTTD